MQDMAWVAAGIVVKDLPETHYSRQERPFVVVLNLRGYQRRLFEMYDGLAGFATWNESDLCR